MAVKKVLKRISIFSLAAIVLTVSLFCCFNRPKKTEAAVGAVIAATTALLAFLAAQGLTITFNGVSSDDIPSEVNSIMNGYSSGGQTWSDWNNNDNWVTALVGKDNATRYFCLSYEFLNWASGLPDWLKTTFGLSIGSSTTISDGGSTISLYSGDYTFIPGWQDSPVYCQSIASESSTTTIAVTDQVFLSITLSDPSFSGSGYYQRRYVTLKFIDISNGIQSSETTYSINCRNNDGQGYFICFTNYNTSLQLAVYLINSSNTYNRTNSYTIPNVTYDSSTVSTISVSGSLSDGYQDLQDALDQDLQDKVAYPDAVGVIDVGAVGGVTDDQIIERTLDKIVANDLDISGVGVGVYDDTATAEEEKDAEKAPTDVEMDNGIVIVDGLEDFFPFCIPFDFIALLEKFNAEPEAPKFTVNIGFGGVFEEGEIEIDLSPFETAAQIFRILMIIGFAIFLILKTRDLIRG